MAPAVLSVSLTNDAASTAQVITKAPASLTSDTAGSHRVPCLWNLVVARPFRGSVVVPGSSSETLSALGVPQACWPVLTMSDLPIDQNACAGATFELMYLGRATQQ